MGISMANGVCLLIRIGFERCEARCLRVQLQRIYHVAMRLSGSWAPLLCWHLFSNRSLTWGCVNTEKRDLKLEHIEGL